MRLIIAFPLLLIPALTYALGHDFSGAGVVIAIAALLPWGTAIIVYFITGMVKSEKLRTSIQSVLLGLLLAPVPVRGDWEPNMRALLAFNIQDPLITSISTILTSATIYIFLSIYNS